MDENKNPEAQTPDFNEEEMKLPENAQPAPEAGTESASPVINGPLLLVLAVLLAIILGGMYYWFNSMQTATPSTVTPAPVERPTAEENNEPESTTAEAQVEQLNTVSPSDEIEAIEADIEATDLDSLDAELEAIDAELEAALNGV